ncbi:MAG: zeta toxin family protein, partial [Pseudomonadota bacterium]
VHRVRAYPTIVLRQGFLDFVSIDIDADEVKKTLPEYDGGIGAHAVHEESSDVAEDILIKAMREGDNIVLPKVGGNPASIAKLGRLLTENGYTVDVVFANVSPAEAMRRMLSRFINTGRLIPPGYLQSVAPKIAASFAALKQEPSFREFLELDLSGTPEETIAALKQTRYGDGLGGGGRSIDRSAGAQTGRPAERPEPRLLGDGTPDDLGEFVERLERGSAFYPDEHGDFFVVRLASIDDIGLAGRNAGNPGGVAYHVARMQDWWSPAQNQGSGNVFHLYKVEGAFDFGQYQRSNDGSDVAGDAIGYTSAAPLDGTLEDGAEQLRRRGSTYLSFPSSRAVVERHVAMMPYADVEPFLSRRGLDDFDDAGAIMGGEVLIEAFEDFAQKNLNGPKTKAPAPEVGGAVRSADPGMAPPPDRGTPAGDAAEAAHLKDVAFALRHCRGGAE